MEKVYIGQSLTMIDRIVFSSYDFDSLNGQKILEEKKAEYGYTNVTDQYIIDLNENNKIEIDIDKIIEKMTEDKAASLGYKSSLDLATYAVSPNPYQAEAQNFVAWRGSVRKYFKDEMTKLKQGRRSMQSIDGFILELPQFTI